MKRIIIIFGIAVVCAAPAIAGSVTVLTAVAPPSGRVWDMTFDPQPDRGTACNSATEAGTLYYNEDLDALYICGTGDIYVQAHALWTRDSVNEFLYSTNSDDKVGIGTSVPTFKLSLDTPVSGADGGILAYGEFGSGVSLPGGGGAQTRLIWYPRRAAFRAGFTSGTQWNDGNVGDYSTAFGFDNQASGAGAAISGGGLNVVDSNAGVVSGGSYNFIGAGADYAAIGGGGGLALGDRNEIRAARGVIGGGQGNLIDASGSHGVIGGGLNNTVNATRSVISGGNANRADGNYSTVSGGRRNRAEGNYSVVSGGRNNRAEADYAAVSGGRDNRAGGVYSMSAGRNMRLDSAADRTFLWGHSNSSVTVSTPDAFIIYSGNVGIGTTNPTQKLHIDDVLRLEPQGSVPTGCAASVEGSLYSRSGGDICYCDGASWISLRTNTPAACNL